MLRQKQAGIPQKQEAEHAPPQNVVNLMDALRRSIAAEGGIAEKKPPGAEPEAAGEKPACGLGKGARKTG
jgi:non-homologous end joining protein Ku